MKKNNAKLNKIKELYNKYKEAKKDPRKKAGLKLLGYLIFFLIIALFANISNSMNKTNTNYTTTTTTTIKIVDTYAEKQSDLLNNKYNINYQITYNKIYKINGTIENNIINGYLEYDGEIKKIIIKNNEIYELKNDEEIILEVEFDINELNLYNLINTIKQTSAFIKEKDNIKTHLYELDNKKIYIESNEEQIKNVKIEQDEYIYNLNFDK